MAKRIILAGIAVYACWFIMDYIIHNVILMETYAATSQFWRPEAEMKMGLMTVVGLISAFTFVLIYARLVSEKSMRNGIIYGGLFGVSAGVGMGYGMYAVMPIPYILAITWFLGSIVEYVVAGIVLSLIVKD